MDISLGTAQFGTGYGIANHNKQVQQSVVKEILDVAWQKNIKHLDTAPTYGNSHKIIASSEPKLAHFEITTKTISFQKNIIETVDVENLIQAFSRSLAELNRPSIDRLLIHQSKDLFKPGGRSLYQAIELLKKKNW
ncbi:aldo/keto reductase [Alphaproteobacteria bacterium]|nr:aldo/keto reductase [Alphaproteobacteria bacterium]